MVPTRVARLDVLGLRLPSPPLAVRRPTPRGSGARYVDGEEQTKDEGRIEVPDDGKPLRT